MDYPTSTADIDLTPIPGKIYWNCDREWREEFIYFLLVDRFLIGLGFEQRIRGSHHIFTKEEITEILNLQPKQGKAKVYQVKQVCEVLLKYQLAGGEDEFYGFCLNLHLANSVVANDAKLCVYVLF
jgi:hypothetical protein